MSLELKRQKKRKKAGLFLKVTTALLLLTTIPFPASATTDINTVFHVYIDDTYAGVVDDGNGIVVKRSNAVVTLRNNPAFLTTIPFPASATTDINTVFHVYIDDTYAGVISDKEVVNKAVIEVIEENQEQYED